MGYFYTAIQLSLYVVSTAWLIFAVVIIREFLLRWLNIAQRKLALEQWRKRITAQVEGSITEQKPPNTEVPDLNTGDEPEVDVSALSTQTLKLLNSAFWGAPPKPTWRRLDAC